MKLSRPSILLYACRDGGEDAFVGLEENGNCRPARYPLSRLEPDERDLAGGRFARFASERQGHSFGLARDFACSSDLQGWFSHIIGWIADNSDERWTFEVGFENVNRMLVVFSFESEAVRAVFMLKFA